MEQPALVAVTPVGVAIVSVVIKTLPVGALSMNAADAATELPSTMTQARNSTVTVRRAVVIDPPLLATARTQTRWTVVNHGRHVGCVLREAGLRSRAGIAAEFRTNGRQRGGGREGIHATPASREGAGARASRPGGSAGAAVVPMGPACSAMIKYGDLGANVWAPTPHRPLGVLRTPHRTDVVWRQLETPPS
ncbi:hypothetical protein [Geodermatophilus sp. CPCC 205506]|uniref:hypothetical protein n=1 Tax=Geodermatophilus sp. CPCC 205506 TaxID=2936596 RepID=UPI003EE8641E